MAHTAMHQDAGPGMERTGWIFSFSLKGFYAVHNLHNCKQQPCLADACVIQSLFHTHAGTNRNMGQAEAERWISLKSSLQLGGGGGGGGAGWWSGGWEDEQGGRSGWVCTKECARDLCCFGIHSGPC